MRAACATSARRPSGHVTPPLRVSTSPGALCASRRRPGPAWLPMRAAGSIPEVHGVASASGYLARGVVMAVEPPLRVEHREELVWLLAQACELEHGLMCEYLFAQFTLKRGGMTALRL